MRKFIIVKDEKESFTKSKCDCKMCKEMRNASIEWDKLQPKTNLQKQMKNAIRAIERKRRLSK